MSSKGTILALAFISNVVVLVGPGVASLVWVAASVGNATDPFSPLGWIIGGVLGVGMIGMGALNIICLRRVAYGVGRRQARGFTWGLVSSGLLGAFVVSVTVSPDVNPWMLIPLASAILTITALINHRPEPLPSFRCPSCDYDLRGLSGNICPECGKPTGGEA